MTSPHQSHSSTHSRRDIVRLGILALALPALNAACRRGTEATLGQLELSKIFVASGSFRTLAKAARKAGVGKPERVSGISASSAEGVKEALAEKIKEDARAGRMTPVRGWMLTHTELDLITLAFPA